MRIEQTSACKSWTGSCVSASLRLPQLLHSGRSPAAASRIVTLVLLTHIALTSQDLMQTVDRGYPDRLHHETSHTAVLISNVLRRLSRPRRCRHDATFRLSRLLHRYRRVGYRSARQRSLPKVAVRSQLRVHPLEKLRSSPSITTIPPPRPPTLTDPPQRHVTTS